MNIIETAISKGYDKFNVVIREAGIDIGQITVLFITEGMYKTVKIYQIYTNQRQHVATQYAFLRQLLLKKQEIENSFNCRLSIDECWGHGPELNDFHRYIQNRQFDPAAVDDLICSYRTYKQGQFLSYLEAVKRAILNVDNNISYTILPASGRPSLERAYKSFRL